MACCGTTNWPHLSAEAIIFGLDEYSSVASGPRGQGPCRAAGRRAGGRVAGWWAIVGGFVFVQGCSSTKAWKRLCRF